MKYPWAVPGRKVVCVDATSGDGVWEKGAEITEGTVYTIRSVRKDQQDGGLVLELCEVSRAKWVQESYDYYGYAAWRFRPLHTIETDIAMFAELLTPAPNAPMLPTKEYIHQ